MNDKLILLPPESMHPWGEPQVLPKGARDYILFGHPGKPEFYTFRFELPENYQIPPFKLSALCCMTVISGELYIGQGITFEKKHDHLMPQESFIVIPPDTFLYFWTDKKTILQFHGMGPVDLIF